MAGEITATPSAPWPPPCSPDRLQTSPGTRGGSCIAVEGGGGVSFTAGRTDGERSRPRPPQRQKFQTLTVWMAPPPRCSRRISMAWLTVMETERCSSRQAATVRQKKRGGVMMVRRLEEQQVSGRVSREGRSSSHLNQIVPGLRSSCGAERRATIKRFKKQKVNGKMM